MLSSNIEIPAGGSRYILHVPSQQIPKTVAIKEFFSCVYVCAPHTFFLFVKPAVNQLNFFFLKTSSIYSTNKGQMVIRKWFTFLIILYLINDNILSQLNCFNELIGRGRDTSTLLEITFTLDKSVPILTAIYTLVNKYTRPKYIR